MDEHYQKIPKLKGASKDSIFINICIVNTLEFLQERHSYEVWNDHL